MDKFFLLAKSSKMWSIPGCVVFFDELGTPGRPTTSWPSSVTISQATTPLGLPQCSLSPNKVFVVLRLIQVSVPSCLISMWPAHTLCCFFLLFPPHLPFLLLCGAWLRAYFTNTLFLPLRIFYQLAYFTNMHILTICIFYLQAHFSNLHILPTCIF